MVCGVPSSTVGCWSGNIGSTPLCGAKWWATWRISQWLVKRKVMSTRIVLYLLFAPSTIFHLEITCSYIKPCSTLHWVQTHFDHSYTPAWILVESNVCQRGFTYFVAKIDYFRLILWVFNFVILFVGFYKQRFLLLCSLYWYTLYQSFETSSRPTWDIFAFTSCGWGLKLLS